MNSHNLQLAVWAAGVGDRKPFYLAVIDGDSRLGFVNSHFFLQYQHAERTVEDAFLRTLVDHRDRHIFDSALETCLFEEKDVPVELRMRCKPEDWVKWDLRFLEAIGEGPGRLFCIGYDLSGEESAKAATRNDNGPIEKSPGLEEWEELLARQKELMYKKVREATIRAEQQERDRIGRELHDNVNQILTSANLFLSCLTPDNKDFEKIKTKTAEILALAIEEIRCLTHNIVSPEFREKGLIA